MTPTPRKPDASVDAANSRTADEAAAQLPPTSRPDPDAPAGDGGPEVDESPTEPGVSTEVQPT